jgi:predicted phage tail protein
MSRGGRIIQVVDPSTTSNLSGLWGLNEILGYVNQTKWPRGPAAPTNLTTAAGNTQLSLGWTAPTTTHGTITNYLVEYTASGGSAVYVLTGSTSTSYTLTGLTNGTSYTVRVAAVNFTLGDWSGTVTGTPAITSVPGAPTGLSVGGRFCGQGVLAWSAPASNGGSAITGYRIRISTDNYVNYRQVSGTSYEANYQLVPGAPDVPSGSFTVRVSAVNSVGEGAYVAASSTGDNTFYSNCG